ncbi:hypothetical protein [Streptosporangium sp. NBC_01756]|uniref:hypothetical protein n=1 Tax=Streptosporangium sp. NBC_01756 TaxID=2975950 RepID=UPI002DDA1A58|nr:hypothetical protein [Streptosporangium sp. NBC_01756]WSC85874.1 site-specific integrase [Streptosporangium sp. NBC_01756]
MEEWLEAHRLVWSPNTVRGYATSLAQWWTFLEQREDAVRWSELGVPAVSAFIAWLHDGRPGQQVAQLVSAASVRSESTVAMRLAALDTPISPHCEGDDHAVVADHCRKGVLTILVDLHQVFIVHEENSSPLTPEERAKTSAHHKPQDDAAELNACVNTLTRKSWMCAPVKGGRATTARISHVGAVGRRVRLMPGGAVELLPLHLSRFCPQPDSSLRGTDVRLG